MAKIIAIANQKGGVGKTTCSISIAAGLKRAGYRVLLIDTDPQCNSTDTYRAEMDNRATLYDLMNTDADTTETIQSTKIGDIIACDKLLEKADTEFNHQGREFILREALEPIKKQYDYIIIDTPPRLGVLLLNALTAADSVIIPVLSGRYSFQGIKELTETINTCKKYSNPDLKIEGILLNQFVKNTNIAQSSLTSAQEIAYIFNTKVFKSKIRPGTAAVEASAMFSDIFEYKPYSNTGLDYNDLVKEIIEGVK